MAESTEKPVPNLITKDAPPAEGQPAEATGEKKLSKKQLNKIKKKKAKEAKKAQKAAERAAVEQKKAAAEALIVDTLAANYGDIELIQSQTRSVDKHWTKIGDIDRKLIGATVLVRGRIHSSRKQSNTLAFLILREQMSTVQAVASLGDHVSRQMIKFMLNVTNESIVDIRAQVVKPLVDIQQCTVKVELQVLSFHVVSRSRKDLPFQMKDAVRQLKAGETEGLGEDNAEELIEEEKSKELKEVIVKMKTRLDNRVIDLRTPANQAIFRLQSAICQLFREYLYTVDFIEIHTPKLIGGVSEGGTEVFRLDYFGKEACLAQSPQLYKQMAIMGDLNRVFEIAPVFRAENSHTHKHMTEFVGLDIEMAIKEHYFEVLEVIGNLFFYIFKGLNERFSKLLGAIQTQYPHEPFLFSEKPLWLTYEEGIAMLHEDGFEQESDADLGAAAEKRLGKLVLDKYKTDFFILHRYPIEARPFYTMLCKDDPKWTCSYDIFMRGEEITSGAQRLHDIELLTSRAKECGIPILTLQDYIDSFAFGAYPHGGCGIGLERVVMLFCNLGNIRKTSMFPRTPNRLFP